MAQPLRLWYIYSIDLKVIKKHIPVFGGNLLLQILSLQSHAPNQGRF